MKEERDALIEILEWYPGQTRNDDKYREHFIDMVLEQFTLKTKKLPVRVFQSMGNWVITANFDSTNYNSMAIHHNKTKQEAKKFIEDYGLELIKE